MTNTKKHRPARRVTEPDARVAYLALGPDRSLAKLAVKLREDGGRKCPGARTLDRWSGKHGWANAAAEFDARVARKVIATVEARAVKTLAQLADDFLRAADEALQRAKALTPQTFGEAIYAAVAATKMALLITGKPTERTESAVAALTARQIAKLDASRVAMERAQTDPPTRLQ